MAISKPAKEAQRGEAALMSSTMEYDTDDSVKSQSDVHSILKVCSGKDR